MKLNPETLAPGIVLYENDFRDVLPTLDKAKAFALLTDPPYGIADAWKGGMWTSAGRNPNNPQVRALSKRNAWDDAAPTAEDLKLILSFGEKKMIWGGNYFELPPSRCWYIWNKPERNFTLAEAELCWTNFDNTVSVFDYARSEPDRFHPTQKPLALMRWCIRRARIPSGAVILEPYAGSGTTGHAALLEGCGCIMIERDPEYAEYIRQRIRKADGRAPGTLFEQHDITSQFEDSAQAA